MWSLEASESMRYRVLGWDDARAEGAKTGEAMARVGSADWGNVQAVSTVRQVKISHGHRFVSCIVEISQRFTVYFALTERWAGVYRKSVHLACGAVVSPLRVLALSACSGRRPCYGLHGEFWFTG